MRFRFALFLTFGLPALLLVIAGAFGQQRTAELDQPGKKGKKTPTPGPSKILEQSFPPNGLMETAWKVEWNTVIQHGLIIKNAWFKRGPDVDWMQVLGDARVSELFVPYHRGSPRFWDISAFNFQLTRVTAEDAGAHGKIHVSDNGAVLIPCVVEELKDRGVIWKNANSVRRGHTVLLWGCIDAGNYRYIIEYGFQDDGSITFRCGATGHNLGGSEFIPHMHNTYWRVDVNLDGKDHNTAQLMERTEPNKKGEKVKAEVVHTSFNGGTEGWADWDPYKFTMVRVINTEKKNIRGENYAYDLMPSRMGNSRHFGSDEACTQHDFWVTKANANEIAYRPLASYCNDERIEDTDVVLWYGSPMFHEPRSEDGMLSKDGGMFNQFVGATHVGWSGFTLRPSNIFDRTPLYPYDKAKVGGKGK